MLGMCVPLAMGISTGDGSQARPAVADRLANAPGDVMRGRQLVIEQGCGGCRGGGYNPANEEWLQGERSPIDHHEAIIYNANSEPVVERESMIWECGA